MTDISSESIEQWEATYGRPLLWEHRQPVSPADFDGIRSSQKNGRAHDITLYIENQGRIAVIAKPIYPPGLFRAPSGGLHPGESLEVGALREAFEETGLVVILHDYLLRAHVIFEDNGRRIDWWTHVFRATTDDEVLDPIDLVEIREARWAKPEEFETFTRQMLTASRGGLRYRAALHMKVSPLHPLFQKLTIQPT